VHVYCGSLCLYKEFSLITEQLSEQLPQGTAGQVVDLVIISDTFYYKVLNTPTVSIKQCQLLQVYMLEMYS